MKLESLNFALFSLRAESPALILYRRRIFPVDCLCQFRYIQLPLRCRCCTLAIFPGNMAVGMWNPQRSSITYLHSPVCCHDEAH